MPCLYPHTSNKKTLQPPRNNYNRIFFCYNIIPTPCNRILRSYNRILRPYMCISSPYIGIIKAYMRIIFSYMSVLRSCNCIFRSYMPLEFLKNPTADCGCGLVWLFGPGIPPQYTGSPPDPLAISVPSLREKAL